MVRASALMNSKAIAAYRPIDAKTSSSPPTYSAWTRSLRTGFPLVSGGSLS
ncbi:hypothetical protein RFN57_16305 [Streptomyces violaceochromogenes]|uniref:Uncharacterized protein n=1 Tax=Streptomyces violaceochromogenes TaxID=67377 RepID=A0ABU6LYY2_9ACTN|nr:hypothetical protein [Streptomyces violaceochromogenes]MEC7053842.1 hypothetical protein [Streptomyces violaceochromogenes]